MSPWGAACGHVRGFEQESARAAHGIEDRLIPSITALAQEERRERFAHWRFANEGFEAAPVERFAGCIDGECAKVVLNPHFQGNLRAILRGANHLCQRSADPFGRRTLVIDFGTFAGDVDSDARARFEMVEPIKLGGFAVKFRQMKHAELADAGEDARGPAQPEVCLPHRRPMSHERYPAGDGLCVLETHFDSLIAQRLLHPGDGDCEDFEWLAHAGVLSCWAMDGQ